jgi:predicted amidohydrolase
VRVCVLELPATWGEPAQMLAEVDARVAAGPAADLVLVPEASLTGYVSPARDFDLTPFAEPLDGPTARGAAAIARARGVHLVAPLVLREGAAIFNAMACFDPRGEVAVVYRKRHPWLPETWATPGPHALPVVAIEGVRVTIAICFDLHFIADDSAAELAAADLLLFPSAWVEKPDSRPARLAELARAFDVVIANANWAPGVVRVPGQGGSCAIARDGSLIARAAPAGRIDFEVAPRG